MLGAVASMAIRHPRRMAVYALAVFVVAGVFGGPALGLLNATNPFSDPSSASFRAEAAIQRATGAEASPGVLAIVPAPPGSPEVASVARVIGRVPEVATVTAPGIAGVPAAGLVSTDGRSVLVAVTLRATANTDTAVSDIQNAVHGLPGVLLGGGDVAGSQTGKQAQKDLGLAEAIAFPLLAILALLIFRGVAAVLPLAVGGMAVLGTFSVLRLVNTALPLSVFASNLVIGLGLGLAVDYSLFLVWRFREELRRDGDAERALRVTLATTGRTVVFSACTVAAALASLTVFPQRFLVWRFREELRRDGDAAEDEQGEDGQQREGDGLGEAEVFLGLLAGLRPGHVAAAEQHAGPAVQRVLDAGDGGVGVGRGAQCRGYQHRTPVGRHQARVVAPAVPVSAPGRGHRGHARDARDCPRDRRHRRAAWRGRHQCQHAGAGLLTGRALDGRLGPETGRTGVTERVRRVEQAEGRAAEHSRDHEHRQGVPRHPARMPDGHTRNPAQHVSLPIQAPARHRATAVGGGCRRCSASAFCWW